MESITETVNITNKVRMMDTLERYCIFLEIKLNKKINDKLTIKTNIIFENTVNTDPHRGFPVTYNP